MSAKMSPWTYEWDEVLRRWNKQPEEDFTFETIHMWNEVRDSFMDYLAKKRESRRQQRLREARVEELRQEILLEFARFRLKTQEMESSWRQERAEFNEKYRLTMAEESSSTVDDGGLPEIDISMQDPDESKFEGEVQDSAFDESSIDSPLSDCDGDNVAANSPVTEDEPPEVDGAADSPPVVAKLMRDEDEVSESEDDEGDVWFDSPDKFEQDFSDYEDEGDQNPDEFDENDSTGEMFKVLEEKDARDDRQVFDETPHQHDCPPTQLLVEAPEVVSSAEETENVERVDFRLRGAQGFPFSLEEPIGNVGTTAMLDHFTRPWDPGGGSVQQLLNEKPTRWGSRFHEDRVRLFVTARLDREWRQFNFVGTKKSVPSWDEVVTIFKGGTNFILPHLQNGAMLGTAMNILNFLNFSNGKENAGIVRARMNFDDVFLAIISVVNACDVLSLNVTKERAEIAIGGENGAHILCESFYVKSAKIGSLLCEAAYENALNPPILDCEIVAPKAWVVGKEVLNDDMARTDYHGLGSTGLLEKFYDDVRTLVGYLKFSGVVTHEYRNWDSPNGRFVALGNIVVPNALFGEDKRRRVACTYLSHFLADDSRKDVFLHVLYNGKWVQINGAGMSTEIKCVCLDILCDVLHKYGNLMASDHEPLLAALFPLLSSKLATVRKKARPVGSREEIKALASTSAGNGEIIGTMIADAIYKVVVERVKQLQRARVVNSVGSEILSRMSSETLAGLIGRLSISVVDHEDKTLRSWTLKATTFMGGTVSVRMLLMVLSWNFCKMEHVQRGCSRTRWIAHWMLSRQFPQIFSNSRKELDGELTFSRSHILEVKDVFTGGDLS